MFFRSCFWTFSTVVKCSTLFLLIAFHSLPSRFSQLTRRKHFLTRIFLFRCALSSALRYLHTWDKHASHVKINISPRLSIYDVHKSLSAYCSRNSITFTWEFERAFNDFLENNVQMPILKQLIELRLLRNYVLLQFQRLFSNYLEIYWK